MKIMIIGGTSGIGLALARHYLEAGEEVAICGRNTGRVDRRFIEHYKALSTYEFDIADSVRMKESIDRFAPDGLDMLIVTAGFYADPPAIARDPGAGIRMLQTNVTGLDQAFDIASRKMISRHNGHLVAVASIAGLLRDYPGISLYSTTKRAVICLCDAYRKALAPFSVDVSAIVPGYVDTTRLRELNGGDASRKPFLCSEEHAVEQIAHAIAQRKARHVFPWQLHWMIKVFNCMPSWIRQLRKK
jgi:short-subunit dehydrogenase